MYGPNQLIARLSHAANSRYVDKRYFVPCAVEDWRRGKIQRQNTEREEEYIQAIFRICEEESIDVIFPSWEPKVYIFSKNKQRFKEKKIFLPVPDYEVLIGVMDKYRLIKTAQQVAFPCPKTFRIEDENPLESIEREIEYPVVVKPRMSSGSRGVYIVRNRTELLEKISSTGMSRGWTLIQEYIPGSQRKRFTSMPMALDQNCNLVASGPHRRIRSIFTDESAQGSAWESFRDDGLVDAATRLCRALNLTGVVNIQTKLDPRDGLYKLLEINPRVGYNFWIPRGVGIDMPLLALKIAMGEPCEPPQRRDRTVFLAPVPDSAALVMNLIELFAAKVLRYRPVDPDNVSPTLSEILKSYRDSYTAPEKIFDPFFAEFFRDPWVSLTWWAAFGVFNLQGKLQAISRNVARGGS
jgi:predicted ATP-grasp superfamily ATP-dependent carboligase